MKPHEAFSRIFVGMRADVHDYRRLRELLEAAFPQAEVRVYGKPWP